MQRKYLEDLGVEKDAIDKIMDENGKDIEKQKKEAAKLSDEVTGLKGELEKNGAALAEANEKIESFKGLDIDGVKNAAEEWKQKYEAHQAEAKNQKKEFEKQMQEKEYEFAAREYVNGLKFTSDFTKKAFMGEFIKKDLKLEGDKFLGAEDFVKQFKSENKGVFEEENTGKETTGSNNSPYFYKPQGGDSPPDLSSIIAGAINGSI